MSTHPLPDAPRPSRERAFFIAATLVIGTAWGATVLLSKFAMATGHDPIGVAFTTAAISALVTTLLLLAKGRRLPMGRAHLALYLACGLFGTALPNPLTYAAITHLPVGIVSIATSTVPMLTMLLGLAIGIERFSLARLCGVMMGAVAIGLIVLPDASLPDPGQAFWVCVAAAAALCYAVENIVVGVATPRGCDALDTMTGLSWAALALMLPVMMAGGRWLDLTALDAADGALVAMSLLHIVSYMGFIWLIGAAGAVFASQVGYVVTLSGVFWGMAVLGERHSLLVWIALATMLAGLTLVKPAR